jgi:hypothetical protein
MRLLTTLSVRPRGKASTKTDDRRPLNVDCPRNVCISIITKRRSLKHVGRGRAGPVCQEMKFVEHTDAAWTPRGWLLGELWSGEIRVIKPFVTTVVTKCSEVLHQDIEGQLDGSLRSNPSYVPPCISGNNGCINILWPISEYPAKKLITFRYIYLVSC